jgi:hypothetical protein
MTKEWWEETPEEFVNGFSEEVQVHHAGQRLQSGRFIDLVNHLPPGTKVSTTAAFERVHIKCTLQNASILQACNLVIEFGYQDNDAEISADGKTISVYAGGRWIPWPAFTLRYEESE